MTTFTDLPPKRIKVRRVWSDAEPCRSGYWMWMVEWWELDFRSGQLLPKRAYCATGYYALSMARKLIWTRRAVTT